MLDVWRTAANVELATRGALVRDQPLDLLALGGRRTR